MWRQTHSPGTSAPGGERRFEQVVSRAPSPGHVKEHGFYAILALLLLLQVRRVWGTALRPRGRSAAQRAGFPSNRLCDRRLSPPHSSTSCHSPRT